MADPTNKEIIIEENQSLRDAIIAETEKLKFDYIFPKDEWYSEDVRKAFPEAGQDDKWMEGCLSYLKGLNKDGSRTSPLGKLYRGLYDAYDALKPLKQGSEWNFVVRKLTGCASLQKLLDEYQASNDYQHSEDPRMQAVCGMIRGFQNLGEVLLHKNAELQTLKARENVKNTEAELKQSEKEDLEPLVNTAQKGIICPDPSEVKAEVKAIEKDLKTAGEIHKDASAELEKLKKLQTDLEKESARTDAKIRFLKAEQGMQEYERLLGKEAISKLTAARNKAVQLEQGAGEGMETWKNLYRLKKDAIASRFDPLYTSYDKLREGMTDAYRTLYGKRNTYSDCNTEQLLHECGYLMDQAKCTKDGYDNGVRRAANAYDDSDDVEYALIDKLSEAYRKDVEAEVRTQMPNLSEKSFNNAVEMEISKRICVFRRKAEAYYECRENILKDVRGYVSAEDLDSWENDGWGMTADQIKKADTEAANRAAELDAKIKQVKEAVKEQEIQIKAVEEAANAMRDKGKALAAFGKRLEESPKDLEQRRNKWTSLENTKEKLVTDMHKDPRMKSLESQIEAIGNRMIIKSEEGHDNSREYLNIKDAVEAFAAGFKNDGVPNVELLEQIGKNAKIYLDAKANDWHIGSRMRYRRIALARELMEFTARNTVMMKQVSADVNENKKVVGESMLLKISKSLYGEKAPSTAEFIKKEYPHEQFADAGKMHEAWGAQRSSFMQKVNKAADKMVTAEKIKETKPEEKQALSMKKM